MLLGIDIREILVQAQRKADNFEISKQHIARQIFLSFLYLRYKQQLSRDLNLKPPTTHSEPTQVR